MSTRQCAAITKCASAAVHPSARMLHNILRVAAAALALPIVGSTATLYVAVNGTGAGTSWTDATNNIQGAIGAAEDYDTVLVSNGTFYLTNQLSIAKPVSIRGLNPPSGVALTRDPAYDTRIVYLDHAEAVLDGFTITNGTGINNGLYNGGGIYLRSGIVTNCDIMFNTSEKYGGGIYVYSSNAVIANSRIISNEIVGASWNGGGICGFGMKIHDCVIADNNSPVMGGGLYIGAASATTMITRCTISGNGHTANQRGAGLTIHGPTLIEDCVISNNTRNALVGGVNVQSYARIVNSTITHNKGTVIGGLGVVLGGSAFVSNCVVSHNESTEGSGGGLRLGYVSGAVGAMTVTHSRIIGNIAKYEGAGVHFQSNGVMEYCSVISNLSQRSGAGVLLAGNTGARLRNCLIAGNAVMSSVVSYYGGGIYISAGGTNTIESCTLAGNQAVGGSGGGLALAAAGADVIRNTIVYSNQAGNGGDDLYLPDPAGMGAFYYSCSPVLTNDSLGNITDSPGFFAPGSGSGVNLAMGDYRLADSSPCINTGLNEAWMAGGMDLDGHPRLDRFSRLADIGCYEHVFAGTLMLMR